VLYFATLRGFHGAVVEAGGLVLAEHTLRFCPNFCPNWGIGLVTGALAVGLAWWFHASTRG
jgi:hypothetical protein